MKMFLGMLLIYFIINLGVIAFGVCIGLLLHWMLPRVSFETGILIGVVTTGFSIHFLSRLGNLLNSLESRTSGIGRIRAPSASVPRRPNSKALEKQAKGALKKHEQYLNLMH